MRGSLEIGLLATRLWALTLVLMISTIIGVVASTSAAQAQNVDWLINITDSPDPVPAGGTINYAISVSNSGANLAPPTFVEFIVPANTTFTGAIPGSPSAIANCRIVPPGTGTPPATGTPLPGAAGDRVACDVPPLAQDESAAFTAQILTTGANTADAVILTVTVRDDAGVDSSLTNNTEPVETTVISGADLGIELNLPAMAASGSTIPFSITVENFGPNLSEGYTVEFPVPPGLAIGSVAPGCALSGGLITCTITTDLLVGDSRTFNFAAQVTVGSGSNIAATTSVASTTPDDPIADNNGDDQTILVTPGIDLFVGIARDTGPNVLTDDPVVFTLSPGYTGDAPGGVVTVTHTVPDEFLIDNIIAPGWTVVQNGNELTFTRATGTFAPGANVSLGPIVIETTANEDTMQLPVTSTVSITGAPGGPTEQNPANNTASINTTIAAPAVDLVASKDGPDPMLGVVGLPYDFTLTASNEGNIPFVGVLSVRDVIPADIEFTAASGTGWTCDTLPAGQGLPLLGPATIECLRTYTAANPLSAGETADEVVVTVIPRADGAFTNTMIVSSPDLGFVDANPLNNEDTFEIDVETPGNSADIDINKTLAEPTLVAGDIQTYTLEILNRSLDGTPSRDITLTDRFNALINNTVGPTGAGFIDAVLVPGVNADGLSCSTATVSGASRSRLLTCEIAELRPCTEGVDCPIVTVRVRHGTDSTTIGNTASVVSTTTPDPTPVNTDTTSFTQTRVMDLTLVKTVSATETLAGQNVSFVLSAEVVPTGRSDARDIVLTDTLPAGMRFISLIPGAPPTPGSPPFICNTTLTEGDFVQAGVNDVISCTLARLNNGQQRTVTVVLQPVNDQIGQTLTNNGEVASLTTPEDDVEPNTDTASTTVLAPLTDLSVNKDDDENPQDLFVVGEEVTYTVTVLNNGPSNSEDIVVTDTLPPEHLAFVSATIDGPGTCRAPLPAVGSLGETLICDFPFLAAGESFEIEIVALGISKGDSINSVSISSFEIENGFDIRAGNNSTSERTTVRTRTDIGLTSKVPSLATVALEDNFTYTITGFVNDGPGLAEADDVVVSDTLPSNMVLTGTPTTPFPGGVCTGAAGGTNFACSLGTVPVDTVFTITVPVEVIAVTADPQTFINSATVTTSSRDVSPGNDTVTGPVDVVSSSLAGTIFRDFADDGLQNGTDTPIFNVPVTLTGTSDDGRPITRTTFTDIDGNYLFELLPAGDYTVTRGTPPNEPLLSDGIDTPGSEGGVAVGPVTINGISLGDDVDATDYDFALIPQATIGLAKDLAGQTLAADGSFTATFDLVVENLSLERLINISVTDPLQGGAPLFGTLVALANPGTDPLAPGTYAMVSAPTGTCGGFNAGFNGAGSQTISSGFALDIGASCTASFTIRVQPSNPFPPVQSSGGRYENQATVTGTGEASDQIVDDISDDGTEPDTDGDRTADEAGENDPTPVNPENLPSIALVKTADISALSSPPVDGETITYSFAVTNTGNVNLTNITLVDDLPGIVLVGGPIPLLAPGQTDFGTFTATYDITQPDLNAGFVINQATVTGTPPAGDPVTDDSGTTNADDTPTTTPLNQTPGIALVKTADTSALSNPPQVGETITYAFAVTNTGNQTLDNVTIADALPNVVITGGPAVIEPGETDTTTFVATYVLVPADLTAGEVINTATVTGNPPTGPPLTDDSTVTTPLAQVPGIDLVKTITDSTDLDDGADVGDVISYAFAVTNTGNVPLFNVTVTDALPGVILSGGPIPLMNPASAADGTDVDTTTYTATYTLTADDILAFGVVTNTATVEGFFGPGLLLSVSDDSSVTASPPNPSDGLVLTKTTPDDTVRRGALVPYTIRLRNDNAFPAVNQTIVDTLPTGLIFVEGSAQVDGIAATPNVVGQVVSFPGLNLAPGQEVVVTLTARILNGTNPGVYVNEAIVLDPLFGLVAGPARASVRVLPEPIFDCGDVIGRVFDDLDGDGYQDAYAADEIPADPLEDHKIEEVVRELTDEVGLPGVRIVTLDGLVITTDENGLFSVPCAALPADGGSNFLLSLDERTLPLGYAMTTQNPRVMRLTPGMLTEMNFGARLSQMMRVDLNAHAFANAGGLTPELQNGIAAMVQRLAEDRTRVELVYHVPAHAGPGEVAAGRASMAAVQAEIARQWSDVGRGRLNITQTIAREGN